MARARSLKAVVLVAAAILTGCLELGCGGAASAGGTSNRQDRHDGQKKGATSSPVPLSDDVKAPTSKVDAGLVDSLVKTTIVALHQANVTGNYSVLRDLGTPTFQQLNSTAKIAEAYAEMRTSGINLLPSLYLSPTFIGEPRVDASGALRVKGGFATAPLRVVFEFAFRQSAGQWRIAAMAVSLQNASAATDKEAKPAKGASPADRKSPAKPAGN